MPKLKTIQLIEKLFQCICPERVDEIAKETGFIKRKRLFTAHDFLSLLFQIHGNLVNCSLQELCTKLLMKQEIAVSRTAIDKKFTPEAVVFLQRIMQELIIEQPILQPSVLTLSDDWPFTSIRVMDSSFVSVPDHLKARACKTRQTSAKIQFEFNILTGQPTFLCVDFNNINDVKMGARRVPFIEEKELCLQDLGYFSFDQFEEIAGNGGFFISKLRSDVYIALKNPFPSFHSNGEVVQSSLYHRIDLAALCKKLTPGEYLELEGVHFGRDAHFSARCILFAHDEEQKEMRIQRIQRRTVQSGKKPKQVVKDLAGITICMTNLPESIYAPQIIELYRLRWQVELIFKVWKSYLEIDHFKLVKQERWLCHLYGTLLVCLISQLIAYQLRNVIWEEEQIEISEMVAIRSIAIEVLSRLYEIYKKKRKAFKKDVEMVISLFIKTARKPNSIKGTALKRLQFA